jgi:large subunit ribosomal protein L25
MKVLSQSGELYEVKTPSHSLQAKVDEVQRDPVTNAILHFSLMHLPKGETGKIEIPVSFTGEAAGIKEGGIFQTVIDNLEIEALPKDFPKELVCDVSHLKIGENVTVADLKYNKKKITIHEDDEKVLAICLAPTLEVVEDEAETAVVTAEATSPEAVPATEEKSE